MPRERAILEALKAVTEIDGAELVRRARVGDGAAWEDIVSAYSRRYSTGLSVHIERRRCEDLTQEVFIRSIAR